ncbi:DUF2897 family protein [Rheinheimera maricola]|uniref:DUF2897 family protein n=1 Tax=Rheinheimera maricola TaxID=2793282 RepID=A0ABS7XEI8_9GAMM|nr:DUF2897 family protein [Rheinheimera maricola]
MNWPLFWALTLAFGVVLGNIMLLKHAAKLKMPSVPKQQEGNTSRQNSPTQQSPQRGQTPNSPE